MPSTTKGYRHSKVWAKARYTCGTCGAAIEQTFYGKWVCAAERCRCTGNTAERCAPGDVPDRAVQS